MTVTQFSRRIFLRSLVLPMGMGLVFPKGAAEDELDQNKVAFGGAVGMAGQEISLPLYLSSPTAENIGELAMEVTFPVPPLIFLRTESTYPAEQIGVKVSAEVVQSRVQVKAIVPGDSKEGLPQGPIAFLVFKVSDDAQGGKLEVVAEHVEMKDLGGRPLRTAARSESQIEIIPKEMVPLFNCFFYMH